MVHHKLSICALLIWLRPGSCVFTSWVSLGITLESGCSLVATRRQVFFSFPSVLRAHRLMLEGWDYWWLWHPCFLIGQEIFRFSPSCHCYSVVKSCLTLWAQKLQHARLPCPSLSPRVCPNSCPLSRWCHPNILSSVALFSSCPLPQHESFPMSWLFTSGGQSTGASASTSVLPTNIQGWFSLGLTLISLLSKGLSRVFSSTTIPMHQFFSVQPSLLSNSHICTGLLEKRFVPLQE